MTIKEAQELVDALITKKNINRNELTNMALLTEESGRLARIIANRYGDSSAKGKYKEEVSEGIGDIFWSLAAIANQTGVDLTAALTEALERNTKKK